MVKCREPIVARFLTMLALVEADWLYTEVREEAIPRELSQHLKYEDRDNKGRLVHIGEEELDLSLKRLGIVRTRLNETYAEMDMGEFRRLRHLEKYDVSPEWVLHHLLQHEAEHRGQMNLLKRLGTETNGRAK